MVKNSPANAGDAGSVPGSGKSPGEWNGNPPQYSCLEKSMDRGAWRATLHGVSVGHNWSDLTGTHMTLRTQNYRLYPFVDCPPAFSLFRTWEGNFPGGPEVKNLLSSSEEWVWSLIGELKVPPAVGQRSRPATTGEACTLQRRPSTDEIKWEE